MKIVQVESWKESVTLSTPYTIAFKTIDAVELIFVRLTTENGLVGVGSASPSEQVTGESVDQCVAALSPERLESLVGCDARRLGELCERVRRDYVETPAAHAALDMALHDLFTQHLGLPLVDFLGRCHDGLATSVTVGIQSVEKTLEETRNYVGQGFRCLKLKLGHSFDEDEERLRKLREEFGLELLIRVDANQGYSVDETLRLEQLADRFALELIEQPMAADAIDPMREFPESLRRRLAADESLLNEQDALRIVSAPPACGIFNIKLMKCGGVSPGLRIASIALAANCEVMWGCNDESIVSIAAALHVAYASPATKYIDLDGSLELSRDPASGGFEIREGRMYLTDQPGLGVTLER